MKTIFSVTALSVFALAAHSFSTQALGIELCADQRARITKELTKADGKSPPTSAVYAKMTDDCFMSKDSLVKELEKKEALDAAHQDERANITEEGEDE